MGTRSKRVYCKTKNCKTKMCAFNWNFQRGGLFQEKYPCRGGVRILSGPSHSHYPHNVLMLGVGWVKHSNRDDLCACFNLASMFLCWLIMCWFGSLQRTNNLTMRKFTSSSKLKNCNQVHRVTVNLETREHVDFILYSMSSRFLNSINVYRIFS